MFQNHQAYLHCSDSLRSSPRGACFWWEVQRRSALLWLASGCPKPVHIRRKEHIFLVNHSATPEPNHNPNPNPSHNKQCSIQTDAEGDRLRQREVHASIWRAEGGRMKEIGMQSAGEEVRGRKKRQELLASRWSSRVWRDWGWRGPQNHHYH